MESMERMSHGGDLAVDTRGMMDGDGAKEHGYLDSDEEPRRLGDTDSPGGRAAVTSVRGGARVPED